MTSEFWGEFEHQLDDKGRVTVPADWRPGLAEGFFLCPPLDEAVCLHLLPMWRWAEIREKLLTVKYDDQAGVKLQRRFSSGQPAKLDGQGRVFIPPGLRTRGIISDKVTLFGAGNHIEIWDSDKRRQYEEEVFTPDGLRETIRQKSL